MSELTIKGKVDPRKVPTRVLVDTYRETGSYREAARMLGVSVQFLHQRIKKHGDKDITTKEFINYHAMTREQIEKYIDSAITEARIEETQSWMEWLHNTRVTYDNPSHKKEKASAELHNLFEARIKELKDNTSV